MPQRKIVHTDLLPGRVRIAVQVYDNSGGTRMYRQPAGYCVAGIDVQNPRELRRLFEAMNDVVSAGRWRDGMHEALEAGRQILAAAE